MIELDEKQISELIEDITGTTKDIRDGLEGIGLDRYLELGPRTLAAIDDAVFTCEGCGWTLSVDERFLDDDGILSDDTCEDCSDCGGIKEDE